MKRERFNVSFDGLEGAVAVVKEVMGCNSRVESQ
jgi:hypothetical protein